MKASSFLSLFLLFLLVDKSFSKFGVRSSLSKAIFKGNRGIIYKWDTTVKNVEKQELSQRPTKQIKGLSRIKEYFSNFGYLLSSAPFNDFLDQETVTAINTYQHYFNLKVTGDLTNETLQQISLPRCGVPDMNFHYDIADNVSWPKARNRWFSDRNLTYGFFPESKIPANATKVLRNAFARWARAVPDLNLTETTYDKANIKVGFYDLDEGVEDVVWGESIIRLHNVVAGEIRLDATKDWKLQNQNDSVFRKEGVLDLESAAMHHIGHLLGLDHSKDEDSVMYPYVLPSQYRKVELSSSDKENIQLEYSMGRFYHGGRLEVILITILSLGFAYVVLLT